MDSAFDRIKSFVNLKTCEETQETCSVSSEEIVNDDYMNEVEEILFENNKEKLYLSITNYKVVSESNDYSLLLLNPDTGRKHQLRRQLSFIKHPILGEKKYTNKGLNKSKELHLMLHAYKVEFLINSKKIIHNAELPLYFKSLCKEKGLSHDLNNL